MGGQGKMKNKTKTAMGTYYYLSIQLKYTDGIFIKESCD